MALVGTIFLAICNLTCLSATEYFVAFSNRFYTYNILSKSALIKSMISSTMIRNASIGVAASLVSDTVVNSIRVVKTTKQAIGSKHTVGYIETVRMILAADGWAVRHCFFCPVVPNQYSYPDLFITLCDLRDFLDAV